jgi:putative methyltransferase (TIGR04325 family)
VRDGRRGFERDGVAFDGAAPWWPGQDAMVAASRANGSALTVLDYGGSLGSLYFQCRARFPQPRRLRWHVVEQPAFVAAGRREFASDELNFHETIDEACAGGVPDVLVLGSVLPYLPRPLATLRELLQQAPDHLLIERTGFVVAGPAQLTVQRVPRAIYPASYPCWFLERPELLAVTAGSYRLTFEQRDDIETPRGLEFRSLHFSRLDR